MVFGVPAVCVCMRACVVCSGVPCLCLAAWQSYIMGGFANGQLRLYNSETGVKVMEVSAHGRPVTALDVAPSAGMVSPLAENTNMFMMI